MCPQPVEQGILVGPEAMLFSLRKKLIIVPLNFVEFRVLILPLSVQRHESQKNKMWFFSCENVGSFDEILTKPC